MYEGVLLQAWAFHAHSDSLNSNMVTVTRCHPTTQSIHQSSNQYLNTLQIYSTRSGSLLYLTAVCVFREVDEATHAMLDRQSNMNV